MEGDRVEKRRGKVFQFLIGTLKTQGMITLYGAESGVSIPHRYAKNFEMKKGDIVPIRGFNSS